MKAQVRHYEKSGCEYVMVDVKVGDWVGFKSDTEQHGQIVAIEYGDRWSRDVTLVLENKNGFPGDYLRYATRTTEYASDCWI